MKTYSTLRVKFWTVLLTISSIFAAFSVLPNVTLVEATSVSAVGAPSNIQVESNFNTITVNWDAPILGSDPITGYQVEYKLVNASDWTIAVVSIDPSLRAFTITDLLVEHAYYVRVAARSDNSIGIYGYPWQLLYETTNPRRAASGNAPIVYSPGYGLQPEDAYLQFSGVDYSRVRYFMSYNSADNYVDADFEKEIDSKNIAGRKQLDQTVNLQIPAYGSSSEFIVKGDVFDLQIQTSGKINRLERGLTGRLELWPYNYTQTRESQFNLGNNSSSQFDDNDTPFIVPDGHGSFQLHEVSQTSGNTIFAWNHHRHGGTPQIGFGNSTGTHRDWTFTTDYDLNLNYFYLGIFINPAIQTGSAAVTYNVTFNANEGTGTLADQAIEFGASSNLTANNNSFTRTGYTFGGWNTQSNGLGISYADGASFTMSSEGITLYAQWDDSEAPVITNVFSAYNLFIGDNDSDLFSQMTVLDNEDPSPVISISSGTIDFTSSGFYSVVVRVTDASGNFTDYSITVSINEIMSGNFNINDYGTGQSVANYFYRGYVFQVSEPTAVTHLIGSASAGGGFIVELYEGGLGVQTAGKVAATTFLGYMEFTGEGLDSSGLGIQTIGPILSPSGVLTTIILQPGVDYILAQARRSGGTHISITNVNIPELETHPRIQLESWIPRSNNSIRWNGDAANSIGRLVNWNHLDLNGAMPKIGFLYESRVAPPIVSTLSPTLSGNDVVFRGELIDPGAENAANSLFIEWSASSSKSPSFLVAATPSTTNQASVFSISLTIDATKEYYYRAVSINENTRVEGEWVLFANDSEFIVNFANEDETVFDSGLVMSNTPILRPEEPSRLGYEFDDWYTDESYSTLYTFGGNMPKENIIIFAKWIPVNYTIEYELNGGVNHPSNPSGYDVTSGNILLRNPNRDGFAFIGWTESGVDRNEIVTNSTGNLTFEANWVSLIQAHIYWEFFEVLAGSYSSGNYPNSYSSFTNRLSGLAPAFSGLSKVGSSADTNPRHILNWRNIGSLRIATTESGLRDVHFATRFTGYFIPEESGLYTFSIHGDDAIDFMIRGEDLQPQIIGSWQGQGTGNLGVYASGVELVAGTIYEITIRQQEHEGGEGLIFGYKSPLDDPSGGWKINPNEIYSVPSGQSFDIVFDTLGGSIVESLSFIAFTPIVMPEESPVRVGYAFQGWYEDNEFSNPFTRTVMPSQSLILYAKWTAINYSITYAMNGGINAANPASYTIEDVVELLEPNRRGYDFGGWYTDATFANKISTIELGSIDPITLHAKWAVVNYPIQYIFNVGNTPLRGSYTVEDETIEFSPASSVGRTFVGWFYDANFTQPATQIDAGSIGGVTIYASWETNSYGIRFIADGRTVASASALFGEAPAISVPAIPPKAGHTAVGWDGEIPAAMPARTIRINAIYEINSYNVTILDGDGVVVFNETLEFGSSIPIPEMPEKEGFTFTGFSPSITTVGASDVSLRAQYEANLFTVTYLGMNGEVLGTADVAFGQPVSLIEAPEIVGMVFTSWANVPATMPAEAISITAQYVTEEEAEELDNEEEVPVVEQPVNETTPTTSTPVIPRPNASVINANQIPVVELPDNPDPVVTRVRINGIDLDVSIIPGQPVGTLPAADLPGYGFKGWMNAITGEMITPETVINNPDYVVLVPLFEKSPSLLDAARNVFQTVVSSPLLNPPKTNDFTERTDNIQSTSVFGEAVIDTIAIRGGLVLEIREDGTVTIPLPNERTPIELNVTGLDAATLEVFYVITDGTPEFDQTNWQAYSGEPFLTTRPGQNVYMMVKDGNDTHQVSFLRPATFISNAERIPATTLMVQASAEQMTSLSQTKENSYVSKIEYENTTIDLFVIEPQVNQELSEVVVRYRANDHNKSMMLNVGAMTWREAVIAPGDSIGVYIRSGDNLDFSVEYRYLNQESITESFVVSSAAAGVSILLPPQPNMVLRAILGVLIATTLVTPLLYKPKAS